MKRALLGFAVGSTILAAAFGDKSNANNAEGNDAAGSGSAASNGGAAGAGSAGSGSPVDAGVADSAKPDASATNGNSGAKSTPGAQTQDWQSTSEDAFAYLFMVPQAVSAYDVSTGKCKTAEKRVVNSGLRARALQVVTMTGEAQYQVIKLDPIESNPADKLVEKNNTDSNKAVTSADNLSYFCLAKSTFDALIDAKALTKYYYTGFTGPVYGLSLVLPFKLRRAVSRHNTQLEPSLTIAGTLGMRWRISHTSNYHLVAPLVTAGFGTLTIAQGTAPSAMSGAKSLLGLTASIGAVVELKDFQLGFMMGVDRAPTDDGAGWIYNGKVWYSFAVGYTFLKSP